MRDWNGQLLDAGEAFLARSAALSRQQRRPPGPRALQAAIHAAHAGRRRSGVTPWREILGLYDLLLRHRPDTVVQVNRAVALAEVEGPAAGLAALEAAAVPDWLPWQAARADLLARLGRPEAATAYGAALALGPAPAERRFLKARRDRLVAGADAG